MLGSELGELGAETGVLGDVHVGGEGGGHGFGCAIGGKGEVEMFWVVER